MHQDPSDSDPVTPYSDAPEPNTILALTGKKFGPKFIDFLDSDPKLDCLNDHIRDGTEFHFILSQRKNEEKKVFCIETLFRKDDYNALTKHKGGNTNSRRRR